LNNYEVDYYNSFCLSIAFFILQETRLSDLHSNSGGGLLPGTKGFSKNDIQFLLFLWAKQFLDWGANQSSAIRF